MTEIESIIHSEARKNGLSIHWLRAAGRPNADDMPAYRSVLSRLFNEHRLPIHAVAKVIRKDQSTLRTAVGL